MVEVFEFPPTPPTSEVQDEMSNNIKPKVLKAEK